MISFERTANVALVRAIFLESFPTLEAERDAEIFDHFTRANHCILARVDGDLAGLYMVVELNPVLAEVHFALLRWTWGAVALEVARAMYAWFWANTSYMRVIGGIAADNPLALCHAKKIGFAVWGRNECAMRKRGKLTDLIMVGMTRGAQ